MNSITKRWVRGSLLVTILMCLVAEAVFLYYSITNYYDGARRAMTTRTSTIITQLNASAAQTGESQGVLLRRMVEQFTEKDKFELMLVNAAGKPLVTSTGFAPDDSVAGEDYLEALASEKGEGHAVYRTAMGEKVMAVTTLLPRAAGEIVAVRFVTSLTLVDQSIAALVAFSLALVTAVVLFSVWTGMFRPLFYRGRTAYRPMRLCAGCNSKKRRDSPRLSRRKLNAAEGGVLNTGGGAAEHRPHGGDGSFPGFFPGWPPRGRNPDAPRL